MRFGLTHAQRHRRKQIKHDATHARRATPRTPFALLPTKMTDGTRVWLERYNEVETWTDCNACWSVNGWWSLHRSALT